MGLHGGKFARVDGADTVRSWSISEMEKQPTAVASNTLLGTARRRGVRSWSGSYEAYGAVPIAGAMPGNIFTFQGYGAPANDVSGNGQLYEGDAISDSVAIRWNWKTGEILSHTVNFSGHLELDKLSGADPGDAVPPNLPEIGGCYVQWAAGDLLVFNTLPHVTQATLTIRSKNQAYVNSSTYSSGVLWTGRKSGPIDWNLSIGQEDEERLTDIFDIGDVINLKLFVDDTNFWLLTYGIVRDFTGIKADRETGAIMARTIPIDMNGYYGSSPGVIKKPGGTQWWPF